MNINNFIDEQKLEMAYAFHDNLRKSSTIRYSTTVFGYMIYTYILILDFDTRIEMNMFFTFVAVVA